MTSRCVFLKCMSSVFVYLFFFFKFPDGINQLWFSPHQFLCRSSGSEHEVHYLSVCLAENSREVDAYRVFRLEGDSVKQEKCLKHSINILIVFNNGIDIMFKGKETLIPSAFLGILEFVFRNIFNYLTQPQSGVFMFLPLGCHMDKDQLKNHTQRSIQFSFRSFCKLRDIKVRNVCWDKSESH